MVALCRTIARQLPGLALLVVMSSFTSRAHAVTQDPLQSRECLQARDALARAQEDATSKQPGAKESLASARKQAQLACLGPDSGDAQRVGASEPPMAVPPPRIEVPRQVQPAVVAPPPLEIPRLPTITSCDPGGCWDSNGHRLNQLGPTLVGPRGACTVIGAVVQCP